MWTFVGEECRRGRQAYVVLPVIDESEKADLRAATTMAEQLKSRYADLEVGLVHGRLKPEERDEVMRRFRDGTVRVLVATTVIEVGIDVPNATIMVVEHPERFGLAQLHQLRGRVGRGDDESYCILLADGGRAGAAQGIRGHDRRIQGGGAGPAGAGHGRPDRRAAVGRHHAPAREPGRGRRPAREGACDGAGRDRAGSGAAAAGAWAAAGAGDRAVPAGGGAVPACG